MLANYLKTTYRHLVKSKLNFIFKLAGLTMALLSFLIIVLYVSYQFSFDAYHEDYQNIYRVNSVRDEDGKQENYSTVPPAIGPALKADLPDVKAFTRISHASEMLVKHNEKLMRLQAFIEADSTIFDVFTFHFIHGDRRALTKPGIVVLTVSSARRLFGTDDVIGKFISFPERGNKVLEVAAIIEDLPTNTHLDISAIMPFGALSDPGPDSDGWQISWDGSVFLFVRLHEQANPGAFSEKMNRLVNAKIAKHDDGREKRFSVFLLRIDDVYLSAGMRMEFFGKGNKLYVYVFSLLGLFILTIACINYINLSIADLHERSKEIGIRKILGARKKGIAFQIILETFFCCLLSLGISILILYLIFPRVSNLLDPDLRFGMILKPVVIGMLLGTVVFVVSCSTAHTMFKITSGNALMDLKKELTFGKDLSLGKVLLLCQFVISVVCISITFTISNQITFLQETDLGFERKGVVSLMMPEEYPSEKIEILKNEISRLPHVERASYSHYWVTGIPYLKDWYKIESGNEMKQLLLNEIFVDHDFFQTMNIDLVVGRGFDIKNPADYKTAFIINETAAKAFGWDQPIGKRIRYGYGESQSDWEGTIIGVSRDFNTTSLHGKIEPLVIRLPYDSWPGSLLNIKVTQHLTATLAAIKLTYEKVLPGYLMNYELMEDIYNNQYKPEQTALRALQAGTWIVVLISAFGIFSLSLFMSLKRMKEFGIRKVLGATARQIALLHMGYFLRIAFVACIIALPVSYGLSEQWLSAFAYRTEWGVLSLFFVPFILLLLIILSAAYAAVKASRMNPVDVIKIQ